MALKIRLSRGGCKNNPHYRVVVIPSQKSRDGQALDIIGHYHPTIHNDQRLVMQRDLFEKYISNGAQPTERVAKLAFSLGIEVHDLMVYSTAGKKLYLPTVTETIPLLGKFPFHV